MEFGLLGTRVSKISLGTFFSLVALLLVLFAVPGQAQTNVNAKINFQPNDATVPSGYTKDASAAYDDARGFGWITQESAGGANPTPLNIEPNTRDRNANNDQRLDTLTHMQFPPAANSSTAVKTPAAWEYKLPNGTYDVTVAVGDPNVGTDPEEHTINFEGKNAVDKFVPSGNKGADTRNKTAKITVDVTDGKLTMDAKGGVNTKPNYVEIVSATTANERPSVAGSNPADGATNVALSTGISTTSLNLVNSGVENSTITNNTVKLIKVSDNSVVQSDVNGTGGGDAINLQPVNNLQPNTQYRFEISDGVKDLDGLAFRPYSATFTTGTTDVFNPPGVATGDVGDAAFDRVAQPNVPSKTYTSVEMGPDNRLYAATVEGEIYRFPVDAQSGELGEPTLINTVRGNTNDCNTSTVGDNGCTNKRLIMGITFEPGSTASNPKLWVSHSTYGYRNMKDWGGKLSVLSGANLGQYRDVLVNVPRSSKDHQINSIAFHNGKIYIPVGATTAMGAYDDAWKGTERLLSTSIIEVDYNNISDTLNTKTVEAGGPYNPYASGAPVKIYATGVRNAVDLVWHSNGQLYVPTNGSAGGSNAPATTAGFADSEACKNRADGPYTGPAIPNFDGDNTDPRNADGKEIDPNTGKLQPRMKISKTQEDYLYRVQKGGYYGNPNPVRCEWVLNGGNPTAGSNNDPGENPAYPDGTKPDRNWRGWAYNFQNNQSPNGAIEYKGDNFGGKLKGKLLVVRYSNGDDIVVLHPNGGNGDINQQNIGVPGLAKNSNGQTMVDPLDLIEDTRSGNLYVTEGVKNPPDNTGKITLLRARDSGEPRPANISLDKSRLITNAVNGTTSAQQTVTVKNEGGSDLNVSGASLSGANAGQFKISSGPTGSVTLAPGEMQEIGVVFDPTSIGPKGASLDIASNDTDTSVAKVNLRGLGTKGTGGSNEPSLQWILDTYEIPVNVGDPDKTNNAMPTDPLLGDEVKAQRFEAASDSPVTVEPLAVFGPDGSNPVVKFGHHAAGDKASKQELFQVSNSPISNAQTLNVPGGEKSFDPGTGEFGFYSTWPFFNNRDVYTQDSLNDFNGAIPHHVRTYPLPGEQNAYIVATEETTSGFDYQDVVVIVRNVKPVEVATPGANIEVQQNERVFSGVKNTTSDAQSVEVRNTGTAPLEISGADITGPNAGAFKLAGSPSFPISVAPGNSTTIDVQFAPGGVVGSLEAALSIASDDPDDPTVDVGLYGLSQNYKQGAGEPTLQDVVNTLGRPTRVHDLSGNPLTFGTGAELKGEEVAVPLFKKAGSGPVGIKPVARYSPDEKLPFGYYTLNAGSPQENVVATIDTGQEQTLNPKTQAGGSDSFDPGSESFGIYVDSLSFGRKSYTQDGLNTGPTKHAARVYPAKNRAGDPLPNAYLVTYEDAANGDYQDYVFLVTNAKPATEASSGDTTKINFQPDSAATPEGYTADSGQAYSASRGYGWVEPGTSNPVDMTNNTRERAGSAEQRLKTLILVNDSQQVRNGVPGVDGTWEMTVPDGTYDVKVSFGDADFYDSSHQVKIEGTPVPASPVMLTQANAFESATATVEVTDSRLSVENSGTNTKLNYVEITNQDTPPEIDTTAPTVDVSIDGLKDGNGAYKNTATVKVNAADEGGSGLVSTAYSLNDGQFKPYDGPIEVTEAGQYTIKARAVDGAGNATTTDAQSFEVVIPPPSKAEIELKNLDGVPFEDRLVFNTIRDKDATNPNGVHDLSTVRIQNTGVETLNVTKLGITPASDFKLDQPIQLPATIAPNEYLDVPVRFIATSGDIRNGTLTITSDDADEPTTEVQLSGFWQSRSEGGQEPNVEAIVKVYGYGTVIKKSGQNINNQGRVETIGDEILSPYWKRADGSKPVGVRQLAAFHTQGNTASFFWHNKGSNTTNNVLRHAGVDGQSLLPRKDGSTNVANNVPASANFTPGNTFGFKIDPEWSDPNKNNISKDKCTSTSPAGVEEPGCELGHHLRVWPAKDRAGDPIANTYIVVMDYAGINYDFNDNVYLVENLRPENLPAPTNLAAIAGNAQVELSWNSLVKSSDVGYNVYRSQTEQVDTSGTSLNGGTPLTEASFTDEGLANGTIYYYAVEAVDGSGSKSAASGTASATPVAPSNNTDFKVNFQSAAAPVPSGYFRDYGQPYGARSNADQGNGMVYGWVEPGTNNPLDLSVGGTNNLGNGRDRNKNSDQRLDTLMHMQAGSATLADPFNGTAKDGSWEVSVPDGTYKVTVAAGDASVNSDPESHTINVEGKNAIDNFVPSGAAGSDDRHKTATVDNVTVSDGRMTIDAQGGDNTKVDYVEVQEAAADTTAPAAPANLATAAGDGKVDLTWNANTEEDLEGYNVYRSETEQVDTGGTLLNDAPLTNASFTDNTAQNGTTYYYALTAVDTTGNESNASTTASATPDAGPAPDTDVKVNFQSETAPVPSGYLRDFGQGYGGRTGADQGSGQSYGWVEPGTSTPLNFTKNGRDRNRTGIEQRLDTVIHMQYGDIQPPGSNGNLEPGAWEIAVPDGTYDVTVSVGDQPGGSSGSSVYDSQHTINIEGTNAIDKFQATAQNEYKQATATVDVTDGELTMDAIGGTNTKPNYVEIIGNTMVAENQAPTVTQPEDQTNVEGDNVTLQVEANDPDANDTLTYEATGLPAGLSIAPDTGEISGTIENGAAQQDPHTVEVTATDDGDPVKSGTVTFNWTVTAPQASGCSPRSTLPCAEVPVELPSSLTFDGTEGGLKDTGFTMVDPPSAPLSTPSNPDVPGYEPSKLDVSGGKLTITSTQGIMFVNPAKSSKTNSQVNALGVGINAAGKTTRIETNVTVPAFPGTTNSEQGGLWFGLDEDNYAKLVVVNTGGGNAKIQLYREIDAVSNGQNVGDEVNTANVTSSGDAVKLTMVPDATAGNVTAFFKVGDNPEIELGKLPLSDKFFAGTKLNQSSTESASFAGVFATNRRGTTPINMSFKDFSVSPESQPTPNDAPVAESDSYQLDQGATLDVNAAEGVLANDTDADQGDTLTAALVDDVQNGTLSLNEDGSFSYEPNSGFSGEDTFNYKVNDGTDDSQPATVTITVNAVNAAPVVDPIQDQSVEAGQTKSVDIAATDADEGDTIELSIEGPAFATLTDNGDGTGSIRLAPDANAVGEHDITVNASDGIDSSSKSFKVTVTEKPNQAPQLTKPENQSATEGDEVSVQVEANDPDEGDTLSYEATGLPAGLSIDPDTGEISGTVELGAAANSPYTVEITVTDGVDSATESFQFEVNEPADTTAPSIPTGLTATPSQDGIALDWANNTEADLAGYNVYRSDSADGTFDKLNNEPLSASEYNDTEAPAGQFSYYRVTAVDQSGNESGFITDSAERPAPDTAPGIPNSLTATPSQDGISLDWDANTESDLAGYNVYRKVDGEADFSKLNNELLSDPAYNDTEAPAGKVSYYRVTAVDEADKESNPATDSAFRPKPSEDTTAPQTSIKSGPSGYTRSRAARFTFSSSEDGSKFECKLDGGSFEGCTSPKDYTSLQDGKHTLQVKATDEAGNTDASAAKRTWNVDTKGPAIYKISPRNQTRDRMPTVRATVKDSQTNLAKSNIKLYFDGKRKNNFSYNQRTDGLTYNTGKLAKKRHTVKIVAVDEAGNRTVKVWRFRVR